MRVNKVKGCIGKVVAVEWIDPTLLRIDSAPPIAGRQGLAIQLDIGVLTDCTEGVLRVCHTYETHPGGVRREGYASYIVLKLVRKILVVGTLDGAGDGGG